MLSRGELIPRTTLFTDFRRTRAPQDPSVFYCVSMMATAVGQALTKHMHEILDLMFQCPLSSDLRQALVDIGHYIPPLLPNIQECLLNLVSIILSGQAYQQPGSPNRPMTTPRRPSTVRDGRDGSTESQDTETVVLALNTLGEFDFTGHVLNEFVREYVVLYLEDDHAEVRKAAALTVCRLFGRDPICYQTSTHAIQIVGEVLEKLLAVGIADPDPMIRQTVLTSLDPRFDRHLAQAEHVRSLFIAVNDEQFKIRQAAIVIIGRLIAKNPAYVMPSLRKTLIDLLTEIEYSNVSARKDESARLLSLLVSSSQRLIKPYVEPMVKVLLPKAKDSSTTVASSIMACLGELAQVGGEDLVVYLPDLVPLILETLQDQSSSTKRDAALKSLGQLASNTGYVIDPYIDYPDLLPTLINILKTETSEPIRQETLKVIGILGALDPLRKRTTETAKGENTSNNTDVILIMVGMGPSSEDYYPSVVFAALMNILRDTSLSAHHTAVIEAVMYIFKTLGLKCVPYLQNILPSFLSVMRTHPAGILDFYFQQLGLLVSIVKQHIRNFLPEIFSVIQEYWNPNSTIQMSIISLIESIAASLEGEFKIYLPQMLPHMLQIFDADLSEKRQPSIRVLHSFVVFGPNVEEYVHLIIPVIVRQFEKVENPMPVRTASIRTIGQMSKKVNLADHASRIIHPIARVMAGSSADLRKEALNTLCSLVFQLGSDYAVFIPMINKVLLKNKITHANYDLLVSKLLKGEPLPQELGAYDAPDLKPDESASMDASTKKLPVNQQHLKSAWEASQRSTKDDWAEWMRRLSVELLRESPSHALRACANLAAVYNPLAKELFNAAFVSCWTELYDQYQDELVRSIETALTSPNITPEILQLLLNLAEFMEHDDKALPIDIRTLGAYAARNHAYAKALHYKELEFLSETSPETIEALIAINNNLAQPDASVGILTYAQAEYNIELRESWYERLNRWDSALAAYEKRIAEEGDSDEMTFGRMRCMHALGEWEQLFQLVEAKFPTAPPARRAQWSGLAAAAAWGLNQWDAMENYINVMKDTTPDGAFFSAILALHRNNFEYALSRIMLARRLLNTELTALVGESYARAYSVVVRVQMLAEMEEIITYKKAADNPERQASMQRTWVKRLKGCQHSVEVWQRILNIRALVVSPAENQEMWIKFANLCRKSSRLALAEKTLLSLQNGPQRTPHVTYAHLKFLWETGNRRDTFGRLQEFTSSLSSKLGLGTTDEILMGLQAEAKLPPASQFTMLLARCFLKQGEWQWALQDSWTEDSITDILRSFFLATNFDNKWYKAWHSWALANFEVISYLDKVADNEPKKLVAYIIPAVQGFIRSVSLASGGTSGNALQDILRFLTLTFKYGHQDAVHSAIADSLGDVNIDVWLQVLPQLIARLHVSSPNVRKTIHQLLIDVGKAHPQALMYPLSVAAKAESPGRRHAAKALIDKMRDHSATLVEHALLVSQELIRVAILWHEMWHEALEEASRYFFGDNNINAMLAVLEPMHELLDKGPETLREVSFTQAFGRDLHEAREWCRKARQTGQTNDFNQAWDLYYQVFRKIARQLPSLTTLELQYVSPKLLAAHDLELAVPGQYVSGKPVVKIKSFDPTFQVIGSKQRPRKLTIRGDDGKEYQYALKGHEDIRQDERVMQLFGLVNNLLGANADAAERQLNIQRFPVIPLATNSGLLGWVPNSDTLHVLIRDYRESRKILLNIEHRLMLQMAPDYDNLTLIQKVEVFEYALDNTTGQDLYRILWLKSRNSEAWLDRRTCYTRSLAVMSMVGYILGLGDRHPSNLMLDRYTGKVVHIDFGDCFEVAMHREKYPEKIPFRLTRMLMNAMEVSGIEGSFRKTCEIVMEVMRDNKESLMAVLEAFVHDPLVNWKLTVTTDGRPDGRLSARLKQDDEVVEGHAKLRKARGLGEEAEDEDEISNERAVLVIERVSNKLKGRDFKPNMELDTPTQVDKLIKQAKSVENLCQCYIGWCAFW